MAITIDFGGVRDGHPTNQAEFAARLVRLALRDVYGQPIAQASGPLFRSAVLRDRALVLSFDEAQGLRASSGELQGFTIAGADRKFVLAKARIVGDPVVVSSDAVPKPASVRDGRAGKRRVNLVNAAGLPASPFRSDDWN